MTRRPETEADRKAPLLSRRATIGGTVGLAGLCVVVLLLSGGCGDDSPDENGAANSGPKPNGGESVADGAPVSTNIGFVEVTDRSGIDFTYRNGEEADNYAIIESLGGGIGLLDFDGDGDLDVVLPGGGHFPAAREIAGHPSALYRNEGGLQFTDVSSAALVDSPGFYSHGVAVTDFDRDGCLDYLVTGYGGLKLFHNMGDGTFEESAAESGLTDSQWSSSAAFADFNADGHPDLYVAHYVNWSFDNHPQCDGPEAGQKEICPPRSFEPLPDTLYLNRGDGQFEEATKDWGLSPEGKGLGVVVGDLDQNGTLDVYIGNDTVPNFLYRNRDGRFETAGVMSGVAYSEKGNADGSMGVDFGDFNGDGLPDLWVANYESESFALYRNEGDCLFQPVSSSLGVTAVGALYVGWGTAFLDADLDGDLDVFGSNGHVIRHPQSAPLRQHPLVFENRAGKRFVNVASAAGGYTASPHMGRGLAIGDLDNDGDIDIIVAHTNEPVSVLENRSESAHAWIGFRLVGRTSSRVPVGATVRVKLKDGSEQVRQLKSGSSYASSSDLRLFFGLGDATAVESAEVRWPSGIVEDVPGPAVGQVHALLEPAPQT